MNELKIERQLEPYLSMLDAKLLLDLDTKVRVPAVITLTKYRSFIIEEKTKNPKLNRHSILPLVKEYYSRAFKEIERITRDNSSEFSFHVLSGAFFLELTVGSLNSQSTLSY